MSKLIASVSVSKKSIPKVILLGTLLSVLTVPYIWWLIDAYSLTSKVPRQANLDVFLLASVCTLILHEVIHAVSFAYFGCKPKFGIKLVGWVVPVLTTSAKGSKLSLGRMLVVGLSPFVLISVATSLLVSIPAIMSYAIAAFCVNFAGSAGDIYMSGVLLRYWRVKNVAVEDMGESFNIIGG